MGEAAVENPIMNGMVKFGPKSDRFLERPSKNLSVQGQIND
jgi:hypothetical protein